jgi:DNA-binding response OmpR family regulator
VETKALSVLVVDDDPGLRELLSDYLTQQGYSVSAVDDGGSMDVWLKDNTPDLVLLDIMLPGEDGLSIARRLRAKSHMPIIMLSARGEDIDRIVGLEIGADDYIAKPFNPRELLARMRAVLRRHSGQAPEDDKKPAEVKHAEFGPFRLDLETHRLTRDGEEVPLTTGEFDLLRIFVENPNRVLSRDRLLDLLKGYERSPFDRSVDVQVARLRGKIEEDSKAPHYIRTVWGKGYLFAPTGHES